MSDHQTPEGRAGDAPTTIHPDCKCLYCTDPAAGFALASSLGDLTAAIAGRMAATYRGNPRADEHVLALQGSELARDVLAALDRLCPATVTLPAKVALGLEILQDAGRIAERLVSN